MYFIGIDIGTSSVKIIVIDENGVIINSVNRSYEILYPKALWVEQRPEDWWKETHEGLKEVLKDLDRNKVKSISLSGQMHGLVTLDKNNNIIRPAILWNDQRTEKQCKYLNEDIGREKISKWTGNMAMTGLTAPKLLWMRENELENFNKIEKILLPKDYIAYKLSGVYATDYSDASGTLYFDVKNKVWSKEMMEILSINENQLPILYDTIDVIGEIREELAKDLGISKNTKIVIGGGDQAVAAIGGGIVNENECSISLGTSGVVFSNSEKFVVDEYNRLHSFCNGNGSYHVMGVTLAAAASLKWWVENINKSLDFNFLLEETEDASIDEEVYFLPYLTGERTPHNDPNAKGVFIGMDITTKRADMTKAVIEGVGFSLRQTYDIVTDMGIEIKEVTINGGGSKSKVWCQIMANILNTRVKKVNSNDGPAYGAAIIAGVGSGDFESISKACELFIKETEVFLPDEAQAKRYNEKYQKYIEIYPSLKKLFIS